MIPDRPTLIVDHHLQPSHGHAQLPQGVFSFAPPAQDYEIVGVGHDARAEAWLQPEHLPSQHKTADVQVCQLGYLAAVALPIFSGEARYRGPDMGTSPAVG